MIFVQFEVPAKPSPAGLGAAQVIETNGLPLFIIEGGAGPGGVIAFVHEPIAVDVGNPVLGVGTIDEVLLLCVWRGGRVLPVEPRTDAQRDQQDEEGKSFHRGAEYMVLGWSFGEG